MWSHCHLKQLQQNRALVIHAINPVSVLGNVLKMELQNNNVSSITDPLELVFYKLPLFWKWKMLSWIVIIFLPFLFGCEHCLNCLMVHCNAMDGRPLRPFSSAAQKWQIGCHLSETNSSAPKVLHDLNIF